MAVAALVCGIVGAVLSFTVIGGLVLGVLAIIFGVIGRNRVKSDPAVPHKGLATAGLVLGIVAVLLTLLWVAAINDAVNETNEGLDELQQEFEQDFSSP